jgi:fatty acid desaturase
MTEMPASTPRPPGSPAKPPRPQGWWSPNLERAMLISLLRKRDAPGLVLIGIWLGALTCTTLLLAASWASWWVIPVTVIHGAVLSFSYAASHECAHGTAFQSTWLNEGVFYLTSFVFGEEPMYRRYTHGRHHSATWYPGFDIQMPYSNPMPLRRYLRETLALAGFIESVKLTLRLARGLLTEEEASFIPATRLSQMKWGARAFVAADLAILAIALLTHSWFIIVALPIARLAGGWVVQLFINSQHMCMAEAVPDHRYSTRSLACWPPTRLLYWNMNYHIEHHLYPGVPFHALPRINELIREQLPQPVRGVLAANVEILAVARRQTRDATHAAQPRFAANQSQ